MTDVCRFDFNSVGVAVFHCSSAVLLMHNGNWTADRGSDKSFAKSRRRKFFWMQRNAGVGERATRRSNNFGAKIFLLPAPRQRLRLTLYGRDLPSMEKQAAVCSVEFHSQVCHESFL